MYVLFLIEEVQKLDTVSFLTVLCVLIVIKDLSVSVRDIIVVLGIKSNSSRDIYFYLLCMM